MDGIVLVHGVVVGNVYTDVFVTLRSRRHTGVAILQHTGLRTFNEVTVHLDGTETENLVEPHDGILQVEWLGQIVIGREGDVLSAHILWCEYTVGHEHEHRLLGNGIGLDLVTEFTTSHTWHILFTDDEVWTHLEDIVGCLLDVIVGMEVVDVFQSG